VNVLSYRGTTEDPRWPALVESLHGHVETFLALRVDGVAAEPWAGQELRGWEWVWAFGPDVELRWREDEGRAWAVVAWDGVAGPDALPEGGTPLDEAERFRAEGEPVSLRLWGTAQDGRFPEGRFPLDLAYPVDVPNGGRACVSVQRYRDDDGEIAWERALGLVAEPMGDDRRA
jgi:hypothetical protein